MSTRAKKPIKPERIPVSLDGMLVHRRVTPCINFAGTHEYMNTSGWREAPWEKGILPKNTTQCPWPGLEPGPLDPEMSAQNMRPPPRISYVASLIINVG